MTGEAFTCPYKPTPESPSMVSKIVYYNVMKSLYLSLSLAWLVKLYIIMLWGLRQGLVRVYERHMAVGLAFGRSNCWI